MLNRRDVSLRLTGRSSNSCSLCSNWANRVLGSTLGVEARVNFQRAREKSVDGEAPFLSQRLRTVSTQAKSQEIEKSTFFLIRDTSIHTNQQWQTQLSTRPQPQRLPPRYVSFKFFPFFQMSCEKIVITLERLSARVFCVKLLWICSATAWCPFL